MAQKQKEILESHDELEELVDLRTDELRSTVQLLESEIEERKQAEQDLLRSRYELRMLTQKTLETLETDRQSVAKELHDSIGASLAAIKFGLEQKLAAMKAGMGNEEISIEKMIDHLVDTIKETKRISANLRPSTLDDLGLIATINWFCRDFGSFYPHLQVIEELNCREEQISENLKIVIYRILQEAMNNAAKHSDADIIRLNLNMADGSIILKVEDNGVGFAVDQQDIRKDPLSGYGIQGMRERAEICGGSFEVKSRTGTGTTVEVRLPLRAEGI
jgi:signal transduction histidine kinase